MFVHVLLTLFVFFSEVIFVICDLSVFFVLFVLFVVLLRSASAAGFFEGFGNFDGKGKKEKTTKKKYLINKLIFCI